MNLKQINVILFLLILSLFVSCNSGGSGGGNSSSANDIITFSVLGVSGTIDSSNNISIVVPFGTDCSSLTPTITISDGANVSPKSGVAQNFTSPVTYTVKAADNTAKVYLVTISSSAKETGSKIKLGVDGVIFNMVYVQGPLTFKTGSDDAVPVTYTNAFWIAETSVTYELWNVVKTWATDPARGSNIYSFANDGWKGSHNTGDINQPVTKINWRDSIIWMNAITEWYNSLNGTKYKCVYNADSEYTVPIRTSTNDTTITDNIPGSQDNPYVNPNAEGFRLLTKTEWELAARYKGSDGSNGAYEWPLGSNKWWTPGLYASGATASSIDKTATSVVAWFNNGDGGDSGGYTHPVKGKKENTLGLYDMSGNVFQWNFNIVEGYNSRYLTGGSFVSVARSTSVAITGTSVQWNASNISGVRMARTAL